MPAVAGIGYVTWLGWSWWTLALTLTTTALIGGVLFLFSYRLYQRERSSIPE
ncbi:MAG TPA: hypothetical protein VMM14_02275 [Acidimicrobiia bacterium]|nr:hypothetical protein [Acidimicrobiia bacterium]